MIITFDINFRDKIESGEYKVQEKNSGRSVRIICWDAASNTKYPIIALIEDYGIPKRYTVEGHCYMHNDDDLIIVAQEPELTEFEKACKQMMLNWHSVDDIVPSNDFVKEEAVKVIDLARKELKPKYDATKVDEALIDKMTAMWRRSKIEIDDGFSSKEIRAYRCGLIDMYKQFAEELDIARRDDV